MYETTNLMTLSAAATSAAVGYNMLPGLISNISENIGTEYAGLAGAAIAGLAVLGLLQAIGRSGTLSDTKSDKASEQTQVAAMFLSGLTCLGATLALVYNGNSTAAVISGSLSGFAMSLALCAGFVEGVAKGVAKR